MKKNDNGIFTCGIFGRIMIGIVLIGMFAAQPAFAEFDYIFFSINGDTTLSTMTQGDEFAWGSNCDVGATVNWEIWYDANANMTIDPATDFILASENMTDGNLLSDDNPVADGWVMAPPFNLSLEPGDYIFRAMDVALDSSLQKIATIVAMSSPPNQFTGQIFLPGVSPPNGLLANRFIVSETESGDEGVFGAFTDDMGQYTINVGAAGTGVEFYLFASSVPGFVAPYEMSAVAAGVVPDNDFTYVTAVDSVWGFVKDETGAVLPFATDISAESDDSWKEATTRSGRYAIYFSSADKGDWGLESSSVNSPAYLTMDELEFSHDTLTSFQYDITLTRTDTVIYAEITENGALPVNNYRVDAYSSILSSYAESVSGTGANNIVAISVSSLDNSGWEVSLNPYDDDLPIPTGFILPVNYYSDVSPGDTVSFNLIDGHLVSGTIVQDPGDGPIDWGEIWVGGGPYGTRVGDGGVYELYTALGSQYIGIYGDGYISDPALRLVEVTGDTVGGLGFVINETHCRVSGALTGLTLPLDGSYYQVVAVTGTDYMDGYHVSAQIDSATGTYQLDLCDGTWTLIAPDGFPDVYPPQSPVVTIGESPDTSRTVDFAYTEISSVVCGDANDDGDVNVGDAVYLINHVFRAGAAPDPVCSGNANGDADVNVGDAVYLINLVFRGGLPPVDGCCSK